MVNHHHCCQKKPEHPGAEQRFGGKIRHTLYVLAGSPCHSGRSSRLTAPVNRAIVDQNISSVKVNLSKLLKNSIAIGTNIRYKLRCSSKRGQRRHVFSENRREVSAVQASAASTWEGSDIGTFRGGRKLIPPGSIARPDLREPPSQDLA